MVRWFVLVAFVVACKKKEEPAPDPTPTTPSVGHSVTKVKDPDEVGSGSAREAAADDAGAPDDAAHHYGGNGKPAYRDEDGHLHGPGGPVFMGRGPECTDKIDHCLRDGVWFACPTVVAGRIYRAVPVFEFEGKWWNFREQEADYQSLFKTKVASGRDLIVGDTVIWLIEDNSAPKWLNSEHDALTSSRWECGIIDTVGSGTLKVKGWDYAIPIDTSRTVVEKKTR